MQEYVSDSGGFYLRDGRWGQGRGGECAQVKNEVVWRTSVLRIRMSIGRTRRKAL